MKTACCVARLLLLCITRSAFRKSFVRIPLTGRLSVFILLLFILPEYAAAQDPVFSDFKKVPIPPSPNSAALGKFGDIPVSPSTGIPSIQIPIYSYSDKQKDLNLNVALSYHAGGHKVEDMASNVGLGWALQAGGAISRTVKGIPDDGTNGYINTPALPSLNTSYDGTTEAGSGVSIYTGVCQDNSADFFTVRDIANQNYDGEADMFNISIGDINEKFFFDKNDSVVLITPSNIYVKTIRVGGGITKFIVFDAKGVSYHFDLLESTQTDNAVEPSVPAPETYVSTWYVSKIVSADGKDEIVFTYANTSSLLYESGLTLSVKTKLSGTTNSAFVFSNSTTFTYDAKRISKITLPDKTILDFYYTHNRQDYYGDKALTSVTVKNGQYEKSYELKYGYFVSDYCTDWCAPGGSVNDWQRRLKLLSVQEISGSDSVPPYLFEYNTTPLPYRSSKEQDWWGYYNGGATGDILPGSPSFAILGREKIPSLTHCKAWTLERLSYPTGGNTKFVYELNEGLQDTTARFIGGLRVQQREDYDPLTDVTYTTKYSYVMADSTTSGLLITVPSYTAYWTKMDDSGDKHIYYNESLNPTQTLSYFNGSPVVYKRVTERQYANGLYNGYKIYEFEPGEVGVMHDGTYPFVQKQDITWNRGLPTRTDVYTTLGVLLSREENEYQTTSAVLSSRNLVVGNYFWDNLGTLNRYLYGARSYHLATGRTNLIKTTRKEYANGEINQTITEYTYDNTHHVPTKVKTTNSKDETIEVRTYYPFNYTFAPYNTMKSLYNRVAEPVSVETWITKGGTSSVRSIIVNEYNTVNTNLLKKNKVHLLESDQPVLSGVIGSFDAGDLIRSALIRENLSIEEFDTRGRGVEFKFTGGERKSVIWGDQNEYPMASVDNAKYSNIAFTSFESSEKGNWTISGTGQGTTDSSAPTGAYSYSLTGNITRTGLDTGKYIVSYWKKSGTVTVNTAGGLAGETINGWTYYRHYLTLSSGPANVTVAGSSAVIDELRLYPATASMTTYTFRIPVGITSSCDANNIITRYEYDVLGRLSVVKDRRNNIIKHMQYHYKGQE